MKSFLYGIQKVYFANDVTFPFQALLSFSDGKKYHAYADWNEIPIAKPGSLAYDFSIENNTKICSVTLQFDAISEFYPDFSSMYFLAQDTTGTRFLIGLGKKYATSPTVEVVDTIGKDASSGNKQSFTVTWKCKSGRIFSA